MTDMIPVTVIEHQGPFPPSMEGVYLTYQGQTLEQAAAEVEATLEPGRLTAREAADEWNRQQTRPNEGSWDQQVREDARERVLTLARKLERKPWQTMTMLTPNGLGRDLVGDLKSYGLLTVAWDETGMPYYALRGTPMRADLLDEAGIARIEEEGK